MVDPGVTIDLDALGYSATVFDCVYVPADTALLAAARARGLRAANGSEMLITQAAIAFERWTGIGGMADVMRAAEEFFEEKMLHGFFPEMKELVSRLQDIGSEIWAVSSTSEWVIQTGMKHFGISASRILAAAVAVEDGKVTDKVIRVPSGKGKPLAIREVIARTPDAVFGNSVWDADMLEIARHPFVINPTPELLTISSERKWPVYFPEAVSSS